MQSCIILFQSSPVTIRKSIAIPVTGDSKFARLIDEKIIYRMNFNSDASEKVDIMNKVYLPMPSPYLTVPNMMVPASA